EVVGVEDGLGMRRSVRVFAGRTLTGRMAGPALRAWNMADVLSREHAVRLVTVNPVADPPPAPFPVVAASRRELDHHVAWADIVILQGHILELAPSIKHEDAHEIVVCDVHDPVHRE